MKHDRFVEQLTDQKLLQAITAAEARSTAKIGVVVSRRPVKDPITSARRHHRTLKLDAPPHRNGVLIFVSPRSRNFSIYAGSGAFAAAGPAFWDHLRDDLASGFQQGRFTEALAEVITQLAAMLAKHFPKPH